MAGAVQGSRSQTALMIVHSASVSSMGFSGMVQNGCDARIISTTVERVKRNLYRCKGLGFGREKRRDAKNAESRRVSLLDEDHLPSRIKNSSTPFCVLGVSAFILL